MKLILILSLLFLTSCGTLSEYERGCNDGLTRVYKLNETVRQGVCRDLHNKRLSPVREPRIRP